MRFLLVTIFLSSLVLGVPKSKPNCRLKSVKTYRDGRKAESFKDVYTKSPEDCDKLARLGRVSSHSQFDRTVNSLEPNCKVWVLSEGKDGVSGLLEYGVQVGSEAECGRGKD